MQDDTEDTNIKRTKPVSAIMTVQILITLKYYLKFSA